MLRFFSISCLTLLSSIFFIASIPCLTDRLEPYIGNKAYQYGDLYRLSNLHRYKKRIPNCQVTPNPQHQRPNQLPIHLCLIGDSFTRHFTKDDFPVTQYSFVHWDKGGLLTLDSSQYNVLLITSIERYAQQRFLASQLPIQLQYHTANETSISTADHACSDYWTFKNDNNLQNICFENDFFHTTWLYFRDSRAAIQEIFFDKINTAVVESPDRKALYLSEEYRDDDEHSIFYPLKSQRIDSIAVHLQQWEQHYRQAGFDEIILALIPNKATIREAHQPNYNQLIPTIEQRCSKHLAMVRTYQSFCQNNSSDQLYYPNDTHWTCEGRQIWLDSLYQQLILTHPIK